jgi:ferredoxin-fold anticodon binding domain-containing protein
VLNSISFSLLAGNTEEEDKKIKDAHLNYMVYDAEVLVTGEVPNEGIRNYVVTQIPLKDFKISRVIDMKEDNCLKIVCWLLLWQVE